MKRDPRNRSPELGDTAAQRLPVIDYQDLLWLAGLIEGEGCIYFVKRHGWRGGIRVQMVDEDIIRRCQEATGLGVVYASSVTKTGKQAWSWSVTRRDDCARLLLALYPVMGERRKQRMAEMTEKICTTFRENGRGNYRRRVTAVTI